MAVVAIVAILIFGGDSLASSDNEVTAWNKYDPLYKKYGTLYNVPWQWLKAISIVESNQGQAKSVARGLSYPSDVAGSVSSDGLSWGLMQTTVATARQFESVVTQVGLNDPETSVRIAAKYLQWVMKNYFKDQESVFRAYNGGPGWKKGSIKSLAMTQDYYSKILKALAKVTANP